LKKARAEKLLMVLAVLVLAALVVTFKVSVRALDSSEYQNYVRTYVEPQGNWTYIEKPMFPVLLEQSQVPIGQNWSIVCPLSANHSYHAYCYGAWINNGSEPRTDYDIYVYNPLGEMESYHTEAAGLPEHLGTTVNEPFFAPKQAGNYTFVIVNDARESNGTESATFMLIENVECNIWHEHYVDGNDNSNLPAFNTSWAYEFCTDSGHVEVWIKVPQNLDMYEARLYLMADSKVQNYTILNGVPLAWEAGLYGEKSSTDGACKYGGYNLESQEYRGVASASCEQYGQDMLINFTAPHAGRSLYHLVFIGEAGSGTVEFLVKTRFGDASLNPSIVPYRGYPQNETAVAYVSNSTDLVNATLCYSVDSWGNTSILEMEIADNRTCTAIIPGQVAGTVVSYGVEAKDALENVLVANGSYPVKYVSALSVTLTHEAVYLGENITVSGILTPEVEGAKVLVSFETQNFTEHVACYTLENGTFTASFRPENVSVWTVQAHFNGDIDSYACESESLTARVEEPTFIMKYSLYLGGGIGSGVAIAGVIVYLKKYRQ